MYLFGGGCSSELVDSLLFIPNPIVSDCFGHKSRS